MTKKNLTPTTILVATLFGMPATPMPARADHCTIAVTTELHDELKVRVPDSIYNAIIVFRQNAPPAQEPLVAHSDCPSDLEMLFVVHNCTTRQIYEYKTFPEGEYKEIDGVPLYIIRGPFDDNFTGLEDFQHC